MAKVSAKIQKTLPIEQCVVAHISAGDEIEISAGDEIESIVDRQGVISIIKNTPEQLKAC